MSPLVTSVLWAAWIPLPVAFFWFLLPKGRSRRGFTFEWAANAVILAVLAACFRQWAYLSGCALSFAVAVIVRWWNRRRRDRARKWLGAKSRALRDAIVRRMRDVTTPRRILRPVPTPS